MTAIAIGRNDPCLCGSGRKYKKCCIDKSEEERRLLFEDPDHPKLSDWFFHYHPLAPFSAAMMLHADLTLPVLNVMSEIINKQFFARGEELAEQIRKEQDPFRLLKYLNKETDVINYQLLIERLLKFENQVTPALLDMLREAEDDVLIEQAARYLGKVADFPLEAVLELAENAPNPYVRSELCVVLGFRGNETVLPVIWKQYFELRNQYPKESLAQGPLYGLFEYANRFGLISKDKK